MDTGATPGGDQPERGLVERIRAGALTPAERSQLARFVAAAVDARRATHLGYVADVRAAQIWAAAGEHLVPLVPGLTRRVTR